ncbi:uncharacterized protein [Argopecten irradians]|uniref:uncharacterized protein n=1 Tax=Argopecten irradians TaxID=31199 RepID=UPI0037184454
MSDNMPFNSREFREFARQWDIELVTSSPTYAQSNGLSERMVQTIKNFLRKAEESNGDPYISLLEYRNTPLSGTQYSPAQLLMSRCLRSKLPTVRETLSPKVARGATVQLNSRQDQQKHHYDKRTKPLSPLKHGDSVRIRTEKTWEPAQVQYKRSEPRSYMVTTPDGRHYRRNRRDLLKTSEPPPIIMGPEPEVSASLPTKPDVPEDNSKQQTLNTTKTVSNDVRTSSGRIVKPPRWLKDYSS